MGRRSKVCFVEQVDDEPALQPISGDVGKLLCHSAWPKLRLPERLCLHIIRLTRIDAVSFAVLRQPTLGGDALSSESGWVHICPQT